MRRKSSYLHQVIAFLLMMLLIFSGFSSSLARENILEKQEEVVSYLNEEKANGEDHSKEEILQNTVIDEKRTSSPIADSPTSETSKTDDDLLSNVKRETEGEVESFQVFFYDETYKKIIQVYIVKKGEKLSQDTIPIVEPEGFLGWLYIEPQTEKEYIVSEKDLLNFTIEKDISFYATYKKEDIEQEKILNSSSDALFKDEQPDLVDGVEQTIEKEAENGSNGVEEGEEAGEEAGEAGERDSYVEEGQDNSFDSSLVTTAPVLDDEAIALLNSSFFTVRYFAQDENGQEYEVAAYIQHVEAGASTASPGVAPTIPSGKSAFDYWALKGSETPFDFKTAINQNIDLTAVYRSEWLVHFFDVSTQEGGSGQILKSLSVKHGEKIDESEAPQVSVVPGKVLTGWKKENETTPFDFGTQTIEEDIQLFPILTDQYTVFFITDGSTVEPQLVNEGNLIVQPANPTRPGYDFSHWSLTKEGTAFDFTTEIVGLTAFVVSFFI